MTTQMREFKENLIKGPTHKGMVRYGQDPSFGFGFP